MAWPDERDPSHEPDRFFRGLFSALPLVVIAWAVIALVVFWTWRLLAIAVV